tara:strand:- start:461 stop:1252 length:792 start_codon:yes stop_codon:yes gene_type:complete
MKTVLEGLDIEYNNDNEQMYKDISNNIGNYNEIYDKLYNVDNIEEYKKTFNFDSSNEVEYMFEIIPSEDMPTVQTNVTTSGLNIKLDENKTYYISNIPNNDNGNVYTLDTNISSDEFVFRRFPNNKNDPDSVYISEQQFIIDNNYDKKLNYYRVKNIQIDGNDITLNHKILGNTIVFNNLPSELTISTKMTITFDKITRKFARKYYHDANDGIFSIENKKSLTSAMDEDIKIMIRQNEQIMLLGGITAATFLVGAYVILRNNQ